MKPARSPRFQSAALRSSIAAISAWGFPGTTFGAEQASDNAAPTPAVQHETRRFMASPVRSRDAKRAAGAPRGDGRAIQEALPRTDAEGSLAATLLCRLFPLGLAALGPGQARQGQAEKDDKEASPLEILKRQCAGAPLGWLDHLLEALPRHVYHPSSEPVTP